jgi:hypothetical protein
LTHQLVQSYLVHDGNSNDQFRTPFQSRTTGLADVDSPAQVRRFSDCELRWFYEHLLALPDP